MTPRLPPLTRTGESKLEVAHRENGMVEKETYRRNGVAHREDGPAITEYRENGTKAREYYYIDGQVHRIDGPAEVVFRSDGRVYLEKYFAFGKQHRIDGPSTHIYDPSTVTTEYFTFHGRDQEDLAGVVSELEALPDDVLRDELERSAYAPLLIEGRAPREIVKVLESGVHTPEGVREVLGGAPTEWVRSYEEAAS